MKIAIGCDHAGYKHRKEIISMLQATGHEVFDKGTDNETSVDYPDFAHPVSKLVNDNEVDRGILICGTANGVAMTANKYKNVRAGICWEDEIAALIRQHNDANIICIPARYVHIKQAMELVHTFLNTDFEGGRHGRRVNKICL